MNSPSKILPSPLPWKSRFFKECPRKFCPHPCLENRGFLRNVLENSSKFCTVQPLTRSYYPLKCHSHPCLDFRGYSRFPLENSSNFWTVQPLTWIWKFQNRLSLTLKILELRGQGRGSLWVKVSNGHPNLNKSSSLRQNKAYLPKVMFSKE